MPGVEVRYDKSKWNPHMLHDLGQKLLEIVSKTMGLEDWKVEVTFTPYGEFDLNYPPVGISIDTGTGKDGWRVVAKIELTNKIAEKLYESKVIPESMIGPDKSYAWMKIFESAFVPIGYRECAR